LKSAGVPRPIAAAAGSAAACVVTVPADIVTQRMQVSWTSWFSASPGGHFHVMIPYFQICLLINPPNFPCLSNVQAGFSILKLEEGVRACFGSAQLGSVCQQPPELVPSCVQVGLHANAFQALGSILKTKGVGGLYAGLSPALARIIPTAVVQVRLHPVRSFQPRQCFESIRAQRFAKLLSRKRALFVQASVEYNLCNGERLDLCAGRYF
jgi:hypothetical protein